MFTDVGGGLLLVDGERLAAGAFRDLQSIELQHLAFQGDAERGGPAGGDRGALTLRIEPDVVDFDRVVAGCQSLKIEGSVGIGVIGHRAACDPDDRALERSARGFVEHAARDSAGVRGLSEQRSAEQRKQRE